MRVKGEKLRALLLAQWSRSPGQAGSAPSVTLVAPDGTERRISARIAADEIAGAAVTGYGSAGIVSRIVSDDISRRERFATRRDIAAAMSNFPRLPHADKNHQAPGAKGWAPQPTFAHTGHTGKVTTVFRSSECNSF